MSEAEKFHASEHPLKRLYEARLLKSFQKQLSLIECPRCKEKLHVYIYTTTGAAAFFICDGCHWLHVRPMVYTILHKVESAPRPTSNTGAIGGALDRIARAACGDRYQKPTGFAHLSGGKRSPGR
jgi:hypothetical protein